MESGTFEVEVFDFSAVGNTDAPDPETIDEGAFIAATSTGKRWEIKLVSVGNWPEFKTETCYERICTPFGCTRVPYPCAYCRKCRKTYYAQVVLDGDVPGGFEKALQECARIAAVPAIPLILAGQIQAAIALFAEGLKTCLIAKGFEVASRLSFGIHSRKECTDWHKC